MKKLKYLFIAIFAAALVTSCGDDEEMLADQIVSSPNFIGFVDGSTSLSGIADGTTYPTTIPVYVSGPSYKSLEGSFTATITVDTENSTAIEGTHFSIPNKTVTVSSEGNYLADIEVIMLTEGIETPLASNPVLSLYLSDASGSGNVVASEKRFNISMLFLCPSELAGNYTVTTTRSDGAVYTFDDVFTETGAGSYRTLQVGTWGTGVLSGEPGFDFFDICDQITVPTQNLANLYSNEVYQVGAPEDSFRNPDTGVITIKYAITFSAGDTEYTSVYVPK